MLLRSSAIVFAAILRNVLAAPDEDSTIRPLPDIPFPVVVHSDEACQGAVKDFARLNPKACPAGTSTSQVTAQALSGIRSHHAAICHGDKRLLCSAEIRCTFSRSYYGCPLPLIQSQLNKQIKMRCVPIAPNALLDGIGGSATVRCFTDKGLRRELEISAADQRPLKEIIAESKIAHKVQVDATIVRCINFSAEGASISVLDNGANWDRKHS